MRISRAMDGWVNGMVMGPRSGWLNRLPDPASAHQRTCLARLLSVVMTAMCLGGFAISATAQSSVVVRVMASNLTSSNNQSYVTAGLDILQGLKPDVVAMQEFNVGDNSTTTIRHMVDTTFGTNFVYFRESGYAIPNGIISRYPFVASGSYDTPDLPDRGYAWAQIHLPGTNDLYIVSVHLKASSGSANETRRATEANEITAFVQSNFPANAWIIVAGDMNLYSDTEAAITTFKTYLSDSPVPVDNNGDPDTNAGRNERYTETSLARSAQCEGSRHYLCVL